MFYKVRMIEYRQGNKITRSSRNFHDIIFPFQPDRSISIQKTNDGTRRQLSTPNCKSSIRGAKKGKIREDRK